MDEGDGQIEGQEEATQGHSNKKWLLSAQGLWKGYNSSQRRIEILKGVDFDLAHGESVAIVGASGIGKSTLLHLLGVLDRPDKGALWYRDEDLYRLDKKGIAKFRNEAIGFVFQFHHLLAEFTALENAMMPALIGGGKRLEARRAAEEILVRVGLKDRLSYRVTKLSGGEQQRVALARALVLKPALLLADEPTGNLDKQNSDKVHDLLLELNQEMAMALVVVTHNMELASYLSRRVTIREGRIDDA